MIFQYRPLGMDCSGQEPIVVQRVRLMSPADRAEVKVNWASRPSCFFFYVEVFFGYFSCLFFSLFSRISFFWGWCDKWWFLFKGISGFGAFSFGFSLAGAREGVGI